MTTKQAREVMAKALKKDPELRWGYVANISALIYDNQRISTSPPKENLKKIDGCNRMGERILKLIFE
jgi:hypothetical protein